MSNYQAALATEIRRYLEADPHLLRTLREGASGGTPPGRPLLRTAPPSPSPRPGAPSMTDRRAGRHPNYGALDETGGGSRKVRNWQPTMNADWLRQHGRPDLAGRARWTAPR